VRRRLLATYVTLTVVILAALEIPLGISYGRSERRDLISRIEHDALVMASISEEMLEGQPARVDPQVARRARGYKTDTGGRVVIVNSEGIAVVDTDSLGVRRSFLTRPELAAALRGDIVSGQRHSQTLGRDLIYVAVPVGSGKRLHGAVRITYPTSALGRRVRRYWLLLTAIAGVVITAATLVGLRFSRTLTHPLARLEDAATAAGEGDLTARAPTDAGPPEVRDLARRFNEMIGRLDVLLRSQQEFVADASHQLRTPLTALRLRLENLERDVAPEGRADLEGALAEVERLARLVDGLLALARADAAEAIPIRVDLRAVVEGRLQAWSAEADARGVRLAAELPETLYGLATPESVEQVLDNLLSNALAVSPIDAKVTIVGQAAAPVAELHVIDQGPGMSEEERNRALDRFWRRGGPGGTGLGLAIASRLVAADAGELRLDEAPGGGLDAVVRLRAAR
jgi:signal transduction histidine kinase